MLQSKHESHTTTTSGAGIAVSTAQVQQQQPPPQQRLRSVGYNDAVRPLSMVSVASSASSYSHASSPPGSPMLEPSPNSPHVGTSASASGHSSPRGGLSRMGSFLRSRQGSSDSLSMRKWSAKDSVEGGDEGSQNGGRSPVLDRPVNSRRNSIKSVRSTDSRDGRKAKKDGVSKKEMKTLFANSLDDNMSNSRRFIMGLSSPSQSPRMGSDLETEEETDEQIGTKGTGQGWTGTPKAAEMGLPSLPPSDQHAQLISETGALQPQTLPTTPSGHSSGSSYSESPALAPVSEHASESPRRSPLPISPALELTEAQAPLTPLHNPSSSEPPQPKDSPPLSEHSSKSLGSELSTRRKSSVASHVENPSAMQASIRRRSHNGSTADSDSAHSPRIPSRTSSIDGSLVRSDSFSSPKIPSRTCSIFAPSSSVAEGLDSEETDATNAQPSSLLFTTMDQSIHGTAVPFTTFDQSLLPLSNAQSASPSRRLSTKADADVGPVHGLHETAPDGSTGKILDDVLLSNVSLLKALESDTILEDTPLHRSSLEAPPAATSFRTDRSRSGSLHAREGASIDEDRFSFKSAEYGNVEGYIPIMPPSAVHEDVESVSQSTSSLNVLEELDQAIDQAMQEVTDMDSSWGPQQSAETIAHAGVEGVHPERQTHPSVASMGLTDAAQPIGLTSVPMDGSRSIDEVTVSEDSFVEFHDASGTVSSADGHRSIILPDREEDDDVLTTPVAAQLDSSFVTARPTPNKSVPNFDASLPATPTASPPTSRRLSARPRSASVRNAAPRHPAHRRILDFETERYLSRNRPLPLCCDFSDVKTLRTAAERSSAYARKINELSREVSGLDIWLDRTRSGLRGELKGARSPSLSPSSTYASLGYANANKAKNFSSISSHLRGDPSIAASDASFPIRHDGSVTRARDVTNRAPSISSHVVPSIPNSVPYPGVYTNLPPSPTNAPTRSSGNLLAGIVPGVSGNESGRSVPPMSLGPKSAARLGGAGGFFSTLGRRGSKRTNTFSSKPAAANGVSGMTISGPVGVVSGDLRGALGVGGGVRHVAGPRMPNEPAGGGVGGGAGNRLSGSSAPPPLPSPTGLPPPPPRRGSFQPLTSSDTTPRAATPTTVITESALRQLMDVLPDASEDTLKKYLERANGDNYVALTLYFDDQQQAAASQNGGGGR